MQANAKLTTKRKVVRRSRLKINVTTLPNAVPGEATFYKDLDKGDALNGYSEEDKIALVTRYDRRAARLPPTDTSRCYPATKHVYNQSATKLAENFTKIFDSSGHRGVIVDFLKHGQPLYEKTNWGDRFLPRATVLMNTKVLTGNLRGVFTQGVREEGTLKVLVVYSDGKDIVRTQISEDKNQTLNQVMAASQFEVRRLKSRVYFNKGANSWEEISHRRIEKSFDKQAYDLAVSDYNGVRTLYWNDDVAIGFSNAYAKHTIEGDQGMKILLSSLESVPYLTNMELPTPTPGSLAGLASQALGTEKQVSSTPREKRVRIKTVRNKYAQKQTVPGDTKTKE